MPNFSHLTARSNEQTTNGHGFIWFVVVCMFVFVLAFIWCFFINTCCGQDMTRFLCQTCCPWLPNWWRNRRQRQRQYYEPAPATVEEDPFGEFDGDDDSDGHSMADSYQQRRSSASLGLQSKSVSDRNIPLNPLRIQIDHPSSRPTSPPSELAGNSKDTLLLYEAHTP
ncbi:hypothetical protein H4R34_001453 [Dimargaris verticillata]|uniref:Uncharacterized protein n=1 Tax=Dimargaris verticillata TaxID=2761393 RepID=A0A9W8B4N3_9FUNG|nr:hypothetical protein H4R34_001453 [Dimargaris verticillata]